MYMCTLYYIKFGHKYSLKMVKPFLISEITLYLYLSNGKWVTMYKYKIYKFTSRFWYKINIKIYKDKNALNNNTTIPKYYLVQRKKCLFLVNDWDRPNCFLKLN